MLVCTSPACHQLPADTSYQTVGPGLDGVLASVTDLSLTSRCPGSAFPQLLLMEMPTLPCSGQPTSLSGRGPQKSHHQPPLSESLFPLRYTVYPYEHIQSAQQCYTTGISPSIFTDEETEAQRARSTCQRSHRKCLGRDRSLVACVQSSHSFLCVAP